MKKIIILLMLLMVSSMSILLAAEGDFYYTKANIWYEKPENIQSINWHLGAILPVGTKVAILQKGGREITFKTEAGAEFTLINSAKYSTITLEKLFEQYFSKENPAETISKLTKEEQDNIKNGEIDVGMSKEAVLMAFGYPPSHRTPNLAVDLWTYWENRLFRYLVYFTDNKVTRIERTSRPK